ncbi:hypothetical protein D3C85_269910 [compost metagenome]
MFRKFVSNLSFSPALVGQLGFYAKRLRKEEATRRIGLIFTVLALVVQSFAVFSPPESANAANPDAIIYNSMANKQELLTIYDRNNDGAGRTDIQQVYSRTGITRQDIVNAQEAYFNTADFGGKLQFVGRTDTGAQGRYALDVPGSSTGIFSGRWLDQPMTLKAVIGKRAIDGGWFAIMLYCGNPVYVSLPPPPPVPIANCSGLTIAPISRTSFRLTGGSSVSGGATVSGYRYIVKNSSGAEVYNQLLPSTATSSSTTVDLPRDGAYTASVIVSTSTGDKTGPSCQKPFTVSPEPRCPLNPELVVSDPGCKPCEDDETIWYKDKDCIPEFDISKSVRNVTQGTTNANGSTAKSSDVLEYTLTVKNVGKDKGDYTVSDSLTDVLEYADIVDLGGGSLIKPAGNENTSATTITWPVTSLKAGATLTKTVSVKVKAAIPAIATHQTARGSYDCKMSNVFGNTLDVSILCPPEKTVERIVTQLPHTGATENMIFAGIVLAVVTYFYARARQVKKEVRLIRRDLNAGTI